MSAELSAAYGYRIVYPSDSHIIEFYPFAARVRDQQSLPYSLAEAARGHGYDASQALPEREPASSHLRAQFLDEYGRILDDVELPERQEDGVHGEGLATLIASMASGRRQLCILNLANNSAIANLPTTAEVEVEAVTDATGARALTMGEAPMVLKGILEKRFVWHELVADAGVKGDRNTALQALLVDEMAIPPKEAASMLDELLAASADLLPQFDKP
jgi:alpha-galactosidase/6-phospho-beta-glucosidase family protein